MANTRILLKSACALALPLLFAAPAMAQTGATTNTTGATSALEEDIVVTATKRGPANVQNVPLAITAFGPAQLRALNFHTLSSLSYSMPNVQLEDNGTSPGYANFSIRGLGISSSIPSIDPTVGVFVDGVYLGIPSGIVTGNFDLDGVEVLRGPQGVLFGRNVTGGAVLLRTTTPTNDLRINAGVRVETDDNYIADGVISGPIVSGVLQGKLALYYNNDGGSFENYDGRTVGKQEELIIRPALRWTPNNDLEFILRGEHGKIDADGPASQNHALYSRDSDKFELNEIGYANSEWDSASLETNLHVGFGHGTITNIVGWRQFEAHNLTDVDGTRNTVFHGSALTEQEQWSEELRYAGTFQQLDLTTGIYYFQQDLTYLENRLLGANNVNGGGIGDFSTYGVFVNGDYHVNDQLIFNLGVRYTHEEKEAQISTLRGPAIGQPFGANLAAGTLNPNFSDSHSWNDISPRVGFQWTPAHGTQIYGYWAKGFRSGGYNFRQSVALNSPGPAGPTVPGPFDAEEQRTIEFGIKHDFMDGRGRVNAAVFHNEIDNMQRELNLIGALGVNQQIVNAADVTIEGVEIEARFSVTDNFMVQANVGYIDDTYDDIRADISNTSGFPPFVVNGADYALHIPRLSPWTYGLTFIHDLTVGSMGVLSSRLSWNHRDRNYFTDNNLGYFPAVDLVDLNFTFQPTNSHFAISLYGTNLTDETTYGGDTVLPDIASFGGDGAGGPRPLPTFSPLNKGREIGAEIRFRY